MSKEIFLQRKQHTFIIGTTYIPIGFVKEFLYQIWRFADLHYSTSIGFTCSSSSEPRNFRCRCHLFGPPLSPAPCATTRPPPYRRRLCWQCLLVSPQHHRLSPSISSNLPHSSSSYSWCLAPFFTYVFDGSCRWIRHHYHKAPNCRFLMLLLPPLLTTVFHPCSFGYAGATMPP